MIHWCDKRHTPLVEWMEYIPGEQASTILNTHLLTVTLDKREGKYHWAVFGFNNLKVTGGTEKEYIKAMQAAMNESMFISLQAAYDRIKYARRRDK